MDGETSSDQDEELNSQDNAYSDSHYLMKRSLVDQANEEGSIRIQVLDNSPMILSPNQPMLSPNQPSTHMKVRNPPQAALYSPDGFVSNDKHLKTNSKTHVTKSRAPINPEIIRE